MNKRWIYSTLYSLLEYCWWIRSTESIGNLD